MLHIGDLALTASAPGKIIIYAKGDPKHSKGDVAGTGQYDTTAICAVLKGTKYEGTLSMNGFTVNSPNGSMWDGKYFEVGDQEAGSDRGQTGLIQTSLSGTTLTEVGETILWDNCYRGLVDVLNPFVLGTKNTPINDRQRAVSVGRKRAA